MMKTIDYIFMALLLAAVLIVGHCSNRKLSDSSDFLTMNKGLNKLQTGLSMAATDFGGSGLVGAVGDGRHVVEPCRCARILTDRLCFGEKAQRFERTYCTGLFG